jgi:hypothetical protein
MNGIRNFSIRPTARAGGSGPSDPVTAQHQKSPGMDGLIQVLAFIFFFVVVPFGIVFGILHRLFGGTHPRAAETSRSHSLKPF